MTTDNRTDFEAWAKSHDHITLKRKDGDYISSHVEAMFAAWQAAYAEALEAAALLFDNHERGGHTSDCMQDICDCAEHAAAIRALKDES